MGSKSRRPTLEDVARLSGMSKTAVSFVLNNRPNSRLSEEAQERIHAAANELGYKPNRAAQSLRSGLTKTIGFISDEVTITRYASGMIRGVLSSAKDFGYTLLISETDHQLEDLDSAIESMLDRNVDGLILGLMAARMIDINIPLRGTPIVIVNGKTTDGLPSVLPEEYEAGCKVAQELISFGHKNIAVLGDLPHIANNPHKSVTIGDRFRGIRDTFSAAGINAYIAELDDWSPSIGYEATMDTFRKYPEITAILAGNDNVAFGAYQALAELGKRIPTDVSVISFDNDEIASYLRPGLTTSLLPYEQMAALGVEMLLGKQNQTHNRIAMPLVKRGSLAKPPH